MKVVITNKATYSREFQYFQRNQFIVLNPRDSVTIDNVSSGVEVSYYRSLEINGFGVSFIREEIPAKEDVEVAKVVESEVTTTDDDSSKKDEVVFETEQEVKESSEDLSEDAVVESSCESPEADLSEFSDDELKRIVQNLGVESRARARVKLESLVLENLPRDTNPRDYL